MSARPCRLWDAQGKRVIAHRYFADPKRTHMAALIECRWAKIGTTIEVINSDTGRLLGQYTRRVNGIEFRGEHHGNKVERRATRKVRGNNEEKASSQREIPG